MSIFCNIHDARDIFYHPNDLSIVISADNDSTHSFTIFRGSDENYRIITRVVGFASKEVAVKELKEYLLEVMKTALQASRFSPRALTKIGVLHKERIQKVIEVVSEKGRINTQIDSI